MVAGGLHFTLALLLVTVRYYYLCVDEVPYLFLLRIHLHLHLHYM
jgi:hypothetical protein